MEVFLGFFGIDSDYLGKMPTMYALGQNLLNLINSHYILKCGDCLNLMHIHEQSSRFRVEMRKFNNGLMSLSEWANSSILACWKYGWKLWQSVDGK